MGVDLKLLPVEADAETWGYSHSMLEMDRHRDLWGAISKVPSQTRPDFVLNSYMSEIPDGTMKGESCYGRVQKTPYGNDLEYVRCGELVDAILAFEASGEHRQISVRNKAVLAYLSVLPRETLVALYWH